VIPRLEDHRRGFGRSRLDATWLLHPISRGDESRRSPIWIHTRHPGKGVLVHIVRPVFGRPSGFGDFPSGKAVEVSIAWLGRIPHR
jgi:hypothetical protein